MNANELTGETIASGASRTCEDCGVTPQLEVLLSHAGYYIGTQCACGPYTRESRYYPTSELAAAALVAGLFGRSPSAGGGKP